MHLTVQQNTVDSNTSANIEGDLTLKTLLRYKKTNNI